MRGERGGKGRGGTKVRSSITMIVVALLAVTGCEPAGGSTGDPHAASGWRSAEPPATADPPSGAPGPVTDADPPADPGQAPAPRWPSESTRPPGTPAPTTSPSTRRGATSTPPGTASAPPSSAAPVPSGFQDLQPGARGPYQVGRRVVPLARGSARPLPTILWFPAVEPARGRPHRAGPVPAGRFPLVLLSHGLHGLPEDFTALASRWAAAGFVVAAPAYPRTNRRATRYQRADIVNQSADAEYVIGQVGLLDTTPGDPLAGHLDSSRIAAVGHSAGGFTTAGLFHAGHAPALRAGVVIAGWTGRIPFDGPPARMLFVHGTADPVVPPAEGWTGYDRVPWARAFLTLPGQGHGRFLRPGNPAYPPTAETITDFLRWTLYDDLAARERLNDGVRVPGVAGLHTGPDW